MLYNKEDNSETARRNWLSQPLHTHTLLQTKACFVATLTFITLIIIILLLFSMYIVTINILCQFIFLSLFTPDIERGDRRSWTVITEVSMTTGIHNIIYI